ncbi:hypothetical protein N7448_004868, partial [Penicillium atrosanguineum]
CGADTPYVAAARPDKLYFIDTRFDAETAKHVKEQIERATVPKPEEWDFSYGGIEKLCDRRNDIRVRPTPPPPYARVLFAKGINRRKPELKVPEHESAGDWLVTYDLEKNTHEAG